MAILKDLRGPQVLRSAADESGAAENDPKSDRQQSIKSWLKPDGTETKDIHEATGLRYVDIKTGEKFEIQVPDADVMGAGHPALMLALFGSTTLATNEASQIRQAVRRGEDPEMSEVEGIKERFDLLTVDRKWREPGEGRVGAKVDRDSLAFAIVDRATQVGKTVDYIKVRQRLDDDLKFFRTARKDPEVTALYNARTGKTETPADVSALL